MAPSGSTLTALVVLAVGIVLAVPAFLAAKADVQCAGWQYCGALNTMLEALPVLVIVGVFLLLVPLVEGA